MRTWWEALTLLERVFAAVAIPATLLLLIQLVMTLVGLGGHDGDLDADGDGADAFVDLDGDGVPDGIDLDGDGVPDISLDTDGDGVPDHAALPGLRLFTFRGIVAFLAVTGWAALAVSRAGHPWLAAVLVGLLLGAAAMVLVAVIMRIFLRLQTDGTVNVENALGLPGEVYLSVPAARSGEGKVNVVIQDTMTECAAVTDEERAISTGEAVTVIGVTRERQLIVMRR
jgi:hypothetical protein